MIVQWMALLLLIDAGATPPAVETGLRITDLAEALPACVADVPAAPNMDIARGCVAGACAGDTYGQMTNAWGVPDACHWNERASKTYCDWEAAGLRAAFPTTEALPLMDAALVSETAWTTSASHRGADGLGVGVSGSCFLRAYEGSVVGLDVRVENGWVLLEWLQLRNPSTIIRLDDEGRVYKLQLSSGVRRPSDRTEVAP